MLTLLALLALSPGPAIAPVQGVTWYVDDDAVGPGTGTPADPFDTIQRAIRDPGVLSGHRILVLPGTYRETLALTGKALEIEGRDGAAATVVDAEGRGRTLHVTDVPQGPVVVRGLTLRGGDMQPPIGSPFGCTSFDCWGGGVLVVGAELRITDCSFVRNRASYGGGLAAIPRAVGDQTLVVVERSRFMGNHARDSGGAISANYAPVHVTDSHFEGNDAVHVGGAIHSERPDDVEDFGSYFEANWCGPYLSYGGAVSGGTYRGSRFVGNHARWGGAATLATLFDCTLVGNRAQHGGGATDSILTRCVVRGNAAERGGGVNFATVEECVLEDNHGDYGGAAFASALTMSVVRSNKARIGGGAYRGSLVRCTVVRNMALESGGGIFASGTHVVTTIDSCILADNAPEDVAPGAASIRVDWSLVASPWSGGGTGTILAEPGFWQPETGDLRLVRDSAAIDLGNPTLPLDPDGTRADAGAFSYDPHTCGAPEAFCAGTPGASLTLAMRLLGAPAGGLEFDLTGANASGFVIVVAAMDPGSGASGSACLGPAPRTLVLASTDSMGNARMTLDEATLAGLGHPVGALRYFQAWQREPSALSGLVTSAASEWRHCR